MSTYFLANSFDPILNIYPFNVKVFEQNGAFYYNVTRYSLICDTLADKFITDIKNKNTNTKITSPLQNSTDKCYIYLECSVSSTFRIGSATIKESKSILPLIDGNDGAEGFTQTYCRSILAIIGQNGKVCQCVHSILQSRLGIINGSPTSRLVSYSI